MASGRSCPQRYAPQARLFVAVPLPEFVCQAIGSIVEVVRERLTAADRDALSRGNPPGGRVRWVRMDGLHVTLRFVGDTAEERLDAIARAMDAAAAVAAPFEIVVNGAGAFPSATRPRALWLDIVGGAESLAGLAGRLDDAFVEVGWPAEGRPFRAHLTVARTDGVRAGPLAARELATLANGLDARFQADRLVLFRSHLGGGPARYEPLHESRLSGTIAGLPTAE